MDTIESNAMSFKDAIEKLGIADYGERIFHSNSHGELFHLMDYIVLAEIEDVTWFRHWFVSLVESVEENWERPESVFQHIPKILSDQLSNV